jgi:hypothetical protein
MSTDVERRARGNGDLLHAFFTLDFYVEVFPDDADDLALLDFDRGGPFLGHRAARRCDQQDRDDERKQSVLNPQHYFSSIRLPS